MTRDQECIDLARVKLAELLKKGYLSAFIPFCDENPLIDGCILRVIIYYREPINNSSMIYGYSYTFTLQESEVLIEKLRGVDIDPNIVEETICETLKSSLAPTIVNFEALEDLKRRTLIETSYDSAQIKRIKRS